MRENDSGRYLRTPPVPRQFRTPGRSPQRHRGRILAHLVVAVALVVLSASLVGADDAGSLLSPSATVQVPVAAQVATPNRPMRAPELRVRATDSIATPASSAARTPPPTPAPTRSPAPSPSPVPPAPPAPSVPTAVPTPAPPVAAPASLPPPPTGWVTVLNQQFDGPSDLDAWILYDGPYGSGPHNCATPSHASVSDGLLRMLMRYEPSGLCGPGWYTAGMMVDEAFGGVDQRVTLRFRIVNGGVMSHHNLPLRWPTTVEWPVGGEENYCEGGSHIACWLFLHYGASNSQVDHSFPVDLLSWHTMRFERRGLVVRAFLDDLTTPIWTYAGTAVTLPETFKRVVLQQECSVTCPVDTIGFEEIQVDWITIENPAP
jgi:hypothetical protein